MKQQLFNSILTMVLIFSMYIVNAQAQTSFSLVGIGSQKITLTLNKMTNLVFPVGIETGTKVSREIAMQKVKGFENILELKAVRQNFTATNLSVIGKDGNLYSFDLQYEENPIVLNYFIVAKKMDNRMAITNSSPAILSSFPVDEITLGNDADSLALKGFMHCSVSSEMMKLKLKGIFIKDSLLWFVFRLKNHSLIEYHPDYFRLFIVDRKKADRTAMQQLQVDPVFNKLPAVVGKAASFSLGYIPFTISKNKKLLLQLSEANGGRFLELEVKYKSLLKARRIE